MLISFSSYLQLDQLQIDIVKSTQNIFYIDNKYKKTRTNQQPEHLKQKHCIDFQVKFMFY